MTDAECIDKLEYVVGTLITCLQESGFNEDDCTKLLIMLVKKLDAE